MRLGNSDPLSGFVILQQSEDGGYIFARTVIISNTIGVSEMIAIHYHFLVGDLIYKGRFHLHT
jgi:hypothetical protein